MDKKEMKELEKEELEKAAGGIFDGKEEAESQDAADRATYCNGDPENGRHEWVRTGSHKEEPYFIFWTKGYDEYRCTKCGETKWVH